ncbi:MAG: hypothetical protein GW859_09810 [Sphingomonadales bacterium]|nr:hypothetical protein [Sphingomonadales bacterium]
MSRRDTIEAREPEIEESWTASVTDALERSRRRAFVVAGAAVLIALLEAIALVILLPLKTVEPYTLLVDRQTGHVEALAPLERQVVSPDAALTRSFLVQYVIARESFDIDNLQTDYRKVALWSAGAARDRYVRNMAAGNPQSPLTIYPRKAIVKVQVISVSSLSPNRSMVRFITTRADPGGQDQTPQYWAAIINYGYSGAAMSAEDRLLNPLGFQVTRYRRDAETLPEPIAVPEGRTAPAPAPRPAPATEPVPQ